MNEGWIKISRGIERHWLWNDGQRLKWWIYLLLHAQWDDDKVLCGNQLIELKRGELIDSVNNLSSVWGCCRKTATQFLATLQKEDMISIKRSCNSKSVISICNYETYQCSEIDEGYNTIDNTSSKIGYNTGSKTTKEKEKNQKNKEKSKEIKKEEKTLKKEFFQGDKFTVFIDIWNDYYYKQTGQEYYFNSARDGKALRNILNRIALYVAPNVDVYESLKVLLERFFYKIEDKWTLNNLTLTNVDAKYNALICQMAKKSVARKNAGVGYVDFRPRK